MRFGSTTTQLPTIPWNNPAVVWLDYDSAIETYVFDDIAHVVSSCTPPTVLLLTLNVNSGKDVGRLDRFRNVLGRDNVPDSVESDADLGVGTDGMARAVRNWSRTPSKTCSPTGMRRIPTKTGFGSNNSLTSGTRTGPRC